MMTKKLDKNLQKYSYITLILTLIISLSFAAVMFYNQLNKGMLNIIRADGSMLSIPYWAIILAILFITLLISLSLFTTYGLGVLLERVDKFESSFNDAQSREEKEKISKLVDQGMTAEKTQAVEPQKIIEPIVEKPTEEKVVETTSKEVETPVVDSKVEEPVVEAKVVEQEQATQNEVKIFDDVDDMDNTVELENREILQQVKELPNYRLELSNAFFAKLKPLGLTTLQERAVYENVEEALLMNDILRLTTTTMEGQRVSVSLPMNTLGHVADNVESYKDALRIFRKLKKIQIMEGFKWKS